MPFREGQPDPHEQVERELDGLIEKYLKIDDSGIPQESLDLVLALGQEQAIAASQELHHDERYEALKAGGDDKAVHNLWFLFRPETRDSLNRCLARLRELGSGQPEEAEEIVDDYFFRQTPLYYLSREGYIRRALEKLGPQKAERFLAITTELDGVKRYETPETQQLIATPEFQARLAEHYQINTELYIILHDMGLNTARLDE